MVHVERSALSVPAANWHMIEKGAASKADAVILDLEDSVAPDRKESSREHVIRAFRELDWGTTSRAYRINSLTTRYCYRDVIEIVEAVGDRVDLIIVPKVGAAEDLYVVATLLAQIELNRGFEPGGIGLGAQIETAVGLVNAGTIARSGPRLQTIIFGPGDYAASVRMPSSAIGVEDEWDRLYPGHRFHFAMASVVAAGRAAGVRVIDGPMAEYRDAEALRRSCLIARSMGFDGKWCIHPDQIAVVNDVFSPTPQEIERARRVVDAYEAATRDGSGVVSLDGQMVDAASIRMAQTVLDLAGQGGVPGE